MLTHGQNGNGRGLRQDITEIACRKKILRAKAQGQNKNHQNEPGPEPERRKADFDELRACCFTSFVMNRGVVRGTNGVRFHSRLARAVKTARHMSNSARKKKGGCSFADEVTLGNYYSI